MNTFDPALQVSDAMREEARRNPDGWIYVITGFRPNADLVANTRKLRE